MKLHNKSFLILFLFTLLFMGNCEALFYPQMQAIPSVSNFTGRIQANRFANFYVDEYVLHWNYTPPVDADLRRSFFELRVASSANPNQRALLGRTSIRNRSFEAPFNSAFIRPGQYSILTITPFIVYTNTASPIAGPPSQTIVNRP